MSSSTNSRPNGSGTQPRGGPFLIQLAGLPNQYSWKDLKDLVRSYATHSIWTDVQVVGLNDRRGSIKLGKWSEAYDAYQHISVRPLGNKVPFVELWDISESPPRLLFRNCNPDSNVQQAQYQHVQRVTRAIASSPQAGYQPQMMQPNTTSTSVNPMQGSSQSYQLSSMQPSITGSQFTPAQIAQYQQQQELAKHQQQQELAKHQQQQALYQRQLAQYQQQQALQGYPYGQAGLEQQMMGMYITNNAGLPVNISSGAIKTETRGVFIQNLAFKVIDSQMAQYFGKAGKVAKYNFPKDSKTGRLRGYGTVMYGSLQDAQRAVEMFNGKEFMGRKLAVRFDTEQTALNPPKEPGPVIADGSGLAKYRSC